ncbi:MAG: hypothetical protein ACHQUC_06920 [Chlamydiales bacterium]
MPRWLTLKYGHLIFWIDSDAKAKHKGKRIKFMYKRERGSVFSIETGEVIKGEENKNPLEPNEIALARRIILRHQRELLQAWDQLKSGGLFASHHFNQEKEFLKWMEE